MTIVKNKCGEKFVLDKANYIMFDTAEFEIIPVDAQLENDGHDNDQFGKEECKKIKTFLKQNKDKFVPVYSFDVVMEDKKFCINLDKVAKVEDDSIIFKNKEKLDCIYEEDIKKVNKFLRLRNKQQEENVM